MTEFLTGLESRLLATVRWTVATGVAFPQKSESILAHHFFTITSCFKNGGLAQLGERLLRKQEVTGSNPALSTTKRLTEDAKQFAFSLSLL